MKIVADAKAIATAVRIAATACPSRTPEDIIQCIKFISKGGRVVVVGTDFMRTVAQDISGAVADGEGECLLQSRQAMQIFAQSEGEAVIESTEPGKTMVQCGNDKYSICTEPPAKHPASLNGLEMSKCYHVASIERVCAAIRRTIIATDASYAKYTLGGVAFDFPASGPCYMIAADGRRMSSVKVNAESHGGHVSNFSSTVVPVPALQSVLAGLDKTSVENVKISLGASMALFEAGGLAVSCRMLEGRFPDWRQMVSAARKAQRHEAKTTVSAILPALRKAEIITDVESVGVYFDFGESIVLSKSVTAGSSSIYVPLIEHGEKLRLKFDANNIRDWLGTMRPEEVVSISYSSDITTGIMLSADDSVLIGALMT